MTVIQCVQLRQDTLIAQVTVPAAQPKIILYKVLLLKSCTPQISFFFFLNDTPPTEIYTLPLHDALPISHAAHEAAGEAVIAKARVATRGSHRLEILRGGRNVELEQRGARLADRLFALHDLQRTVREFPDGEPGVQRWRLEQPHRQRPGRERRHQPGEIPTVRRGRRPAETRADGQGLHERSLPSHG